ncbi:MAG: hypothetical protein RL572_849 [Pseudomonadota bacterium]|jgi:DUF971 family protein
MSIAPSNIVLRRKSGLLVLEWPDGSACSLEAEFLRVLSPSAEVRGHGRHGAVLQTGKRRVGMRAVEAVGHYAIRILFDDGHESGIYSWDYLQQLCANKSSLWAKYLAELAAAGASRDPAPKAVSLSEQVQVITIAPLSQPRN